MDFLRQSPHRVLGISLSVGLGLVVIYIYSAVYVHVTNFTARDAWSPGSLRMFSTSTEKYPPLIFYTRTEKCGGRSMLKVIEVLSKRNRFNINHHSIVDRRPPLSDLVSDARVISRMPTPGIFENHMHYIDFTKFGLPQPVYFNMIRDPIEQYVSLYNFRHYGDSTDDHLVEPVNNVTDINDCILLKMKECSGGKRFRMGSFFCGQYPPSCRIGSNESVATAKRHIDEHYIFVGITEEFENTLRILERVLPDYFTGAVEIWRTVEKEMTRDTATKHKQQLNETARELLRKWMWYEYQVYEHVKDTFDKVKDGLGIH